MNAKTDNLDLAISRAVQKIVANKKLKTPEQLKKEEAVRLARFSDYLVKYYTYDNDSGGYLF